MRIGNWGGSGRVKAAVTLSAALVLGLVAGGATFSAFTASTSNAGNSFGAGTVTLSDNSSGSRMFSVPALRPGSPVSRCIEVAYTGTLPAAVKLYGATTGGTGLESYLNLTVTRGTTSTAFGDCSGFTADSSGATLFTGLLSAYPRTLATAIADPNAAWAKDEKHAYRFTVDVVDTADAEGRTATQTFTWDAR
ncbi:TasA family protein [Actinoplanes sp. NPDC051494]|uniref:TasA family protein n=1 Tax=Actinoplanes sp. NPDC051494 TaxID=3363907 RepID=UPI0037A2164F